MALYEHQILSRDGKAQCKCGWWTAPLLSSVHRLHVADETLAAVLAAAAELHADNILALEDAKARTHAMGLLLLDSGDITPMGTRLLDKIWETTE